jgi:FMN phosphatase YigB (HAD superfamily)/choline kinase
VTRARPLPAFAGVGGFLFDFGGTLDGDGLHWLDHFCALYRRLGLDFPRERIRAAFDFAESQSLGGEAIREASLEDMVGHLVDWQFSQLAVSDREVRSEIVRQFVDAIRQIARRNVGILSGLVERGFRLGVISNGCGNTARLCAELGYAPFFDFVLDSTRVGLRKPDPQFHLLAAAHLGLRPAEILMIGDSFERDIKPAHALGMRTIWLKGTGASPDEADAVIDSLAVLPHLLPANVPSSSAIKAGIFAAGQGARLRSIGQPKPLITIGGQPLIAHVLESFAEVGASEVAIIINEEPAAEVQRAVAERRWPFALRWIVKTTPSSMESFLRVIEALAADGSAGPFLISTVDTILPPNAVAGFFREAGGTESDVTLAVNAPAEDDNPLWVRCPDKSSQIVALGDDAAGSGLATAGLYAVRPAILREAAAAREEQITSLRKFLGRLLERGYSIAAVPIANSVDVDRPSDIIAAEELISQRAP